MSRRFTATILFLFIGQTVFAQRFSQYFTNTMFESFENPAQGIFIPDSSRAVAFNCLIPNFTANLWSTGNLQRIIKPIIFDNQSTITLPTGKMGGNQVDFNANVYLLMLKLYEGPRDNQELGFAAQVRGEGHAFFTDESAALFDGGSSFDKSRAYVDLFNDKLKYQTYYQFSLAYRKSINNVTSWGVKLSALSGIVYQDVNINHSSVTFDEGPNPDRLFLSLTGTRKSNVYPETFDGSYLPPTFKNPGMSVSVGLSTKSLKGYMFQYNLKDLGFIRWNSQSNLFNFNHTITVLGLRSSSAGQNIFDSGRYLTMQNGSNKGFISPTDGRFEASIAKVYGFDIDKKYTYTPILIGSKQLFNKGFTGAMVNNFQHGSLVLGAVLSYNDMRQFNFGGQLMIKSPNFEFFIGCEQLYPAYILAEAAIGSSAAANKATPYTSAGFFMGFSVKLGEVIRTAPYAHYTPMGERDGFLHRLFNP